MKNCIKKIKLAASVIAICFISIASFAQVNLNITEREGVVTTIRASDIADLLPWATNSKLELEEGLKNIKTFSAKERLSALRELTKSVVLGSGNKQNELLMRVVLNRAMTVDEIVVQTSTVSSEQESLLRKIYKDSVYWATKLAVDDIEFLNKARSASENEIQLTLPLANFGINYAAYLVQKALQAPTHEASIAMLKLSMGLLFNDLNNSQNRREFAPVTKKIAELARQIENQNPVSPLEKLYFSRKIKSKLDEIINQVVEANYKIITANAAKQALAEHESKQVVAEPPPKPVIINTELPVVKQDYTKNIEVDYTKIIQGCKSVASGNQQYCLSQKIMPEIAKNCSAYTKSLGDEKFCLENKFPPEIIKGCASVAGGNRRYCLSRGIAPDLAKACGANTRSLDNEKYCLENNFSLKVIKACGVISDDNQSYCFSHEISHEIASACAVNTKTKETEKYCLENRLSLEVIQGCEVIAKGNQRYCLSRGTSPAVAKACADSTKTLEDEKVCLEGDYTPEIIKNCGSFSGAAKTECASMYMKK